MWEGWMIVKRRVKEELSTIAQLQVKKKKKLRISSLRSDVLTIDHFHNGHQIKYSFVSMLISLSNLAAMGKIQKNI